MLVSKGYLVCYYQLEPGGVFFERAAADEPCVTDSQLFFFFEANCDLQPKQQSSLSVFAANAAMVPTAFLSLSRVHIFSDAH